MRRFFVALAVLGLLACFLFAGGLLFLSQGDGGRGACARSLAASAETATGSCPESRAPYLRYDLSEKRKLIFCQIDGHPYWDSRSRQVAQDFRPQSGEEHFALALKLAACHRTRAALEEARLAQQASPGESTQEEVVSLMVSLGDLGGAQKELQAAQGRGLKLPMAELNLWLAQGQADKVFQEGPARGPLGYSYAASANFYLGNLENVDNYLEMGPEDQRWMRFFVQLARHEDERLQQDAPQEIRRLGWEHPSSPYLALLVSLSQRSQKKDQYPLLAEALEKAPRIWPYPVLEACAGKRDWAALEKETAEEVSEQTDVRAYRALWRAAGHAPDFSPREYDPLTSPQYFETCLARAWKEHPP